MRRSYFRQSVQGRTTQRDGMRGRCSHKGARRRVPGRKTSHAKSLRREQAEHVEGQKKLVRMDGEQQKLSGRAKAQSRRDSQPVSVPSVP